MQGFVKVGIFVRVKYEIPTFWLVDNHKFMFHRVLFFDKIMMIKRNIGGNCGEITN